MYIDNQYTYGHLIDSESFDITLKNPEVYQLFENRYDWEQRYIHPEYMDNFNPDKKPAEVINRISTKYLKLLKIFFMYILILL